MIILNFRRKIILNNYRIKSRLECNSKQHAFFEIIITNPNWGVTYWTTYFENIETFSTLWRWRGQTTYRNHMSYLNISKTSYWRFRTDWRFKITKHSSLFIAFFLVKQSVKVVKQKCNMCKVSIPFQEWTHLGDNPNYRGQKPF